MRVDDAAAVMTKQYLDRVVDSFAKDFPRLDEEKARETIARNVDELTDGGRIQRQLSFDGTRYSDRVLQSYILRHLLSCTDYACDEASLVRAVAEEEASVVASARDPDSLRWEEERALSILEAVLDIALEDDRVSEDELNLIARPRLNGGKYLIPHEVAPGVKAALGIELADKPWRLLLTKLSNAHLAQILEASHMPKSGTKEELVERIIAAAIQPSAALDVLSNQDLYEICGDLPGAKVSGSKREKIDRIIEYFDNLVVKEIREDATPGERYYEYLVELARRDRENLLTNKVIKKDLHMERAFEEGLRYLFTEKLGLELLTMPGSDHPDGALAFPNGDLFMWDAKSKEDVYTFPPTHLKQFKRYIRDSSRRVACFMVIVPEVAPGAAQMAARLKVESKTDTDASIITAEDLLWLAGEWSGRKTGQPLNVEVFNVTGILDRGMLGQRLKLFREYAAHS